MKILILSFNYQPDFCAGSFRSTALVKYLQQVIESEDSIEVITTMPNRYRSRMNPASEYEKQGNVTIHRIPVPAHDNGKFEQFFVFGAFSKGVRKLVENQDYDLIYASSARLFTARLGAKIAHQKQIPLFLDIRDIFTESIRDTSKIAKYLLLPFLKRIEKNTIKSATHINFVSEGFKNTFDYFKGKTTFFTNGIDDVFLGKNYERIATNSPKIITYAGNIGEGQGLEKIIPQAAKALAGKYTFNIIGDGGTKKKLAQKLLDLQIDNVNLINPINQEDLIKYYQESDYLFLHLNEYKAFEKVLPSKIFEYGATNRTIIAGVSGYAKDFIQNNIENAIVFEPNNVESLIKILENHEIVQTSRTDFIQQYNRKSIMLNMAKCLVDLAKSGK
ncbi:MAG: glycosyltransferase family 4 protein [Arcicella sp.]|nr:glycosyltransferase family 4 protein [Arcicella sp.]